MPKPTSKPKPKPDKCIKRKEGMKSVRGWGGGYHKKLPTNMIC